MCYIMLLKRRKCNLSDLSHLLSSFIQALISSSSYKNVHGKSIFSPLPFFSTFSAVIIAQLSVHCIGRGTSIIFENVLQRVLLLQIETTDSINAMHEKSAITAKCKNQLCKRTINCSYQDKIKVTQIIPFDLVCTYRLSNKQHTLLENS